MRFPRPTTILALTLATVTSFAACKSSGGLIGPGDETKEAGEIVRSANADLKEIKKLYEKNEYKREELKQAMSSGEVAAVQKLSGEIVDLINEGAGYAKNALDKVDQAQNMNINEDYAEYLRLKWEALNKQLEAFEEYLQAARELRERYDPKNDQVREAVAIRFTQRSENYQKLMEKARDRSSEANELAKEALRRQTE